MSVLSSNAVESYSNISIIYITELAIHHSFLPQDTVVLLNKLHRNLTPPPTKVGRGQEEEGRQQRCLATGSICIPNFITT
jgi:hypothetical protein